MDTQLGILTNLLYHGKTSDHSLVQECALEQ